MEKNYIAVEIKSDSVSRATVTVENDKIVGSKVSVEPITRQTQSKKYDFMLYAIHIDHYGKVISKIPANTKVKLKLKSNKKVIGESVVIDSIVYFQNVEIPKNEEIITEIYGIA